MKIDYQTIRKLIEDNPSIVRFGTFGQGVADEWIRKAETRLKVKFPPSYIWWLKNYHGGDIYGDEIFSIYERDFDSIVGGDIVYMNELDRKNGLLTNEQLSIQTNDQAETYFLSLNEVDDLGECPVYIDLNKSRYADNFLHFLAKKIQE